MSPNTTPRAPTRSAGRALCSAAAGVETAAAEVLIETHPAERRGGPWMGGKRRLTLPAATVLGDPSCWNSFSVGDHLRTLAVINRIAPVSKVFIAISLRTGTTRSQFADVIAGR